MTELEFAGEQPATRVPPAPTGGPMRVAICIATCRRPHGLRRLLEGIERLSFVKTPAPELRVAVVENGAAGEAREVCAEAADRYGCRVDYDVEPRVGIPFARNRAVRSVSGWAESVAFIDDDETPEPAWLDELLHVQRAYEADVVAGPAMRHFEGPVPDWIVRGRFFEQRRRPTGTRLERTATSNALVRTRVFDTIGGFDERFAVSGGSDTHLFLRAGLHGFRMVWADDAVVHESVPPGRATLGWLLRRSYRVGNTWSLCERELHPGAEIRRRRLRAETRKLVANTARLLPAALAGKVEAVRCLRRISEASGNLSGLLGMRYEEFHPSRWLRVRGERAA
jgi:succinoglycan biosynthesis protein ExoM